MESYLDLVAARDTRHATLRDSVIICASPIAQLMPRDDDARPVLDIYLRSLFRTAGSCGIFYHGIHLDASFPRWDAIQFCR